MLTFGVEEEFLLLDPDSGHNVPLSRPVLDALPEGIRELSRLEFRRSMVELVTPVCTDLGDLRERLLRARRAASEAARSAGARLVAVGATPVAEPDRRVADDPRFEAIGRHYGPIAHDAALCGGHVHVGLPERALAVEVGNHLRLWLPVVQALAANSPLYAGADTGHASWRSIQLQRWPTAGPPPYFASLADYDRTVAELVASTAMLDDSMVLWYVRPSDRYPTIEIRVSDVCLTADDTILIAGIVRALVATAIDDVVAGRPAPPVPEHLLRAAHWSAAHHGLDGVLFDPFEARARPAWELVERLVAGITPALYQNGDLPLIDKGLARLRDQGSGAHRQRRLLERAGSIVAVLPDLGELTIDG